MVHGFVCLYELNRHVQFRRLVWKSGLQAYPKKKSNLVSPEFLSLFGLLCRGRPFMEGMHSPVCYCAHLSTSLTQEKITHGLFNNKENKCIWSQSYFRGHFYNHPFGAAVPDIGIWDPDTIDRTESSKYVLPRGNLHLYWEVLATVSLKLFIPQTLMFATNSMAQNGDQVKFKRFPDSWT